MYYHFDYHGGPVSYEWVDSTPLAQTWDAMTQAWDYGIRELWIVNVGDLKLHEVPLTYFMALAYDFDKWSTGNPDSPAQYLEQWTKQNFPQATEEQRKEIAGVFRDYVAINSLRRPEALHAGVYHPCHNRETDRMLALAEKVEARSEKLMRSLCPRERDAYYSMIHFSAMASMNLLKMHLYAGKNHHYAAQGKVVANRYAALTEDCIRRDWELAEEFAAFRGGKWAGMELAPHIGFTRWNDEGSCYPVLHHVTPMPKAEMKVSRADRGAFSMHVYGGGTTIPMEDFCFEGRERVTLEIANSGKIPFDFTIGPVGELPEWLTVEPARGTVTEQAEVSLICHREKLPREKQLVALFISDGKGLVIVKVAGKARDNSHLPPMTFVPRGNVLSILAEHYAKKKGRPRRCLLPDRRLRQIWQRYEDLPFHRGILHGGGKTLPDLFLPNRSAGSVPGGAAHRPQQPGCPGRKREPAGGNRNPGAEGAAHRPGFPGGREQRPPLVRRRAGPDSHRRNPISV